MGILIIHGVQTSLDKETEVPDLEFTVPVDNPKSIITASTPPLEIGAKDSTPEIKKVTIHWNVSLTIL